MYSKILWHIVSIRLQKDTHYLSIYLSICVTIFISVSLAIYLAKSQLLHSMIIKLISSAVRALSRRRLVTSAQTRRRRVWPTHRLLITSSLTSCCALLTTATWWQCRTRDFALTVIALALSRETWAQGPSAKCNPGNTYSKNIQYLHCKMVSAEITYIIHQWATLCCTIADILKKNSS